MEFCSKLMNATQKQIRLKKTLKQLLLKQLALENVNENCQAMLCAVRERQYYELPESMSKC